MQRLAWKRTIALPPRTTSLPSDISASDPLVCDRLVYRVGPTRWRGRPNGVTLHPIGSAISGRPSNLKGGVHGVREAEGGNFIAGEPDGEPAPRQARALSAVAREAKRTARHRHAAARRSAGARAHAGGRVEGLGCCRLFPDRKRVQAHLAIVC